MSIHSCSLFSSNTHPSHKIAKRTIGQHTGLSASIPPLRSSKLLQTPLLLDMPTTSQRTFASSLLPTRLCSDGPASRHSNSSASLPTFVRARSSSSFRTTTIPKHTVGTLSLSFLVSFSELTVPCSFSIAATHVVPRTYIRDPLVIEDIQRREERCRQNGGLGTLVVIIQCGATSQVMPVEVDPPAKITWDSRDDWAQCLSHFVETGRTDFKPISTTSRGIIYG